MPPHLQIQLLGDFRLARDHQPVLAAVTTRLQALLAYLALHRDTPLPRAQLAFRFWPDSSEKQALTNLRHLLHTLRRSIPESGAFIAIDHQSLIWQSTPSVQLDIADFSHALDDAEHASRRPDRMRVRRALETAVALFRGELLPDCSDEWIEPHRERMHREAAGALEHLVRECEDTRDYTAARRYAQQSRDLDPTHETTIGTLMRLHVLAGDRAAAMQTYQEGVMTLRRELAIGPGQPLRELHARLLAGDSLSPATRGASPPARGPELPLHGRQAEWQLLRKSWAHAAQGQAHLLLILGEAGIGKSRLAEELCLWLERQGGLAARTRSYAAEGRLPFAPAAQWLRTPGLRPRLAKLEPVWRAEVARILPEEGGPDHAQFRARETEPESWQRHRLFEGLSRAVVAAAEPVALLLDDLQWTDHETLEWLRFLLRFASHAPLLIVGTVRTEELRPDHPLQRLVLDLRRDEQITEVQLGPLSAAEAALVAADVAERDLSGDEASWLYRETEGNPLFVVERVRAGLRSRETGPAPDSAPDPQPPFDASLPPKVYAVIATRLAQISAPARDLAVLAAVVGRACSLEILRAVSHRSDEETVQALEELGQRRILRETAGGGYDFTHDKLREVTYAEASAPRRQWLHRRAAEFLEREHATNPDRAWAQIAAHLDAGGMPGPALAAYRHAAEAAKRVHANDEAIRLFRKALALLPTVVSPDARAVEELELNTALGVCLVAAHGYPAAEVKGIYERAIELCRELGRPTGAPILRALAIASLTSGDLERAEALGRELLAIHARDRDPVVYVEAQYVLGVTFFWLGRFAESRTHLEEAIAYYDPQCRETHLSHYAQDPKAVCLCRLAWTLWYLGYPEQSRRRLDEAVALADQVRHPHTQSYVYYFGAQICLDARDEARAAELLAALARLSAAHTHFFWEFRGRILQHLHAASRERADDNLAQVRQHMAMYARGGDPVIFSQFYGYQARLQWQQGNLRAGFAAIVDAFAILESIDERHFVPELHRLRGELLVAQAEDAAEAESCFHRALQLAREQQSRSMELRAAMSLGRLWQSQRKQRQARELVAAVYGWFSEGLDTPDLKEARALLQAWSP